MSRINEFTFDTPLNDEEIQNLQELGRQILSDVVSLSRRKPNRMDWQLESQQNSQGVTIYRGKELKNNGRTYFCGVSQILAALEEVAALFHANDENTMRDKFMKMQPNMVDLHILHTIASPSAENPMHSVKLLWKLFKPPTPLVKNRDFCVLEVNSFLLICVFQ